MGAAKLSREQVTAIVAAVRAGRTQTSLAAEYGVSVSAINYRVAKRMERPCDQPLSVTCGTRKGYQRHKARGGAACQACNDANNAYRRAWVKGRLT
jgi:hypothetical protein